VSLGCRACRDISFRGTACSCLIDCRHPACTPERPDLRGNHFYVYRTHEGTTR
jgi:hypothetical protein